MRHWQAAMENLHIQVLGNTDGYRDASLAGYNLKFGKTDAIASADTLTRF